MDFCGDSNTGDGCAHSFPNKSSHGLCAKCTKLATLTQGSVEYEQWKNYKQCESCGIAWKHLDTLRCGRCISAKASQQPVTEADAQNLIRTAVESSRAARSTVMEARLSKHPIPQQQLHTTAGLTAAKNNVITGDNNVFITAQCRIKTASAKDQKNTDPSCGQWGKPWPKDTYMSEVLDDYLATLNVRWCNETGMALEIDEVEIRWAGNKLFLPGDANRSVGDIYNTYLTGDMAHYYATTGPTTKKAAGAQPQFSMALELYIDKPRFLCRHRSTRHLVPVSTAVRKRSATITNLGDNPLTKRHAIPNAVGRIESTFVRTSCSNNSGVNASTIVQIKKAHATCNTETGEVEVEWPENAPLYEAIIGKDVFASGATKNVYKLSIGSDLYVAKRFFEIGTGMEVTADENQANLENELIRLKMAGWFLSKFKTQAKDCGIEHSADIIVSDGFLVREIGKVSPASSLPTFEEDTAVWLVEPRRTKSVRKFSGTLVHPNRTDKLGKTLSAFSHFVYQWSGQEMVLADIQGSPMTIGGVDTLVLFDLMSHSKQSDSGIGDHGPDGIKAFISQHRCNNICLGLKLDAFLDEKDSDSGNEEE